MPEIACKYFKVTGRVQGVSFRAYTQHKARSLKLSGWVRNCSDGSVELIACGSENALSDLEEWLHDGPDFARVVEVIVEGAEPERFDDFQIRY